MVFRRGRKLTSNLTLTHSVCQAALSHPSVKLLALVPWAPVHLGALALSAYFTRLEALPSLMKLGVPISSVRYLLQDCPRGFFLSDKFVEGLQWLGEKGVGFDMTLDVVQLGAEVLEDAVDCIQQVREGQAVGKQTRFILGARFPLPAVPHCPFAELTHHTDHFAKPPLIPSPTFPPSPAQEAYIAALFSLSLLSDVSLKLSGMLDSAEPTLVREAFDEWRAARERKGQGEAGKKVDELRRRVLTFLEPAVEAFGEERIVVGSGAPFSGRAVPPRAPLPLTHHDARADWPMFRAKTISPSSSSSSATLNKEEESAAWAFEMELYRTALVELGVEGEGLDRVFEGNARGFYGC